MTDLRDLCRAAEDQGWTVEPTNNGHLCWIPPDPAYGPVYTCSTPSDWRATRNIRSHLRQRGFVDRVTKKGEQLPMVAPQDLDREPPCAEDTSVGDQEVGRADDGHEDMMLCVDCGTLHPQSQMARTPRGDPTQYCRTHMYVRRTAGRRAQAARAQALKATLPDTACVVPSPDTQATQPGVPDDIEALLGTLSDLERRVDARLSAIEARPHLGPLEPRVEVIPSELSRTLLRFGQRILSLAEFDECVLSAERKYELVAGEAARLAQRLARPTPGMTDGQLSGTHG